MPTHPFVELGTRLPFFGFNRSHLHRGPTPPTGDRNNVTGNFRCIF